MCARANIDMRLSVPDVVSDNVTDACRRVQLTPYNLFQKAATEVKEGGFSNAFEVGERWYRLWAKKGYHALPPAVKQFILDCNEGHYCHKQLPVPNLFNCGAGFSH